MFQFRTQSGSFGALLQRSGEWFVHEADSPERTAWLPVRTPRLLPPPGVLEALPETVREAARQVYAGGVVLDPRTLQEAKLQPGEYHPRIWRGRHDRANPFRRVSLRPHVHYGDVFVQSVVAARSLFDAIVEVFRFVEPSPRNFQTYSHRFRELVILTCTELEANLRAIYNANSSRAPSSRLTTTEYVRLRDPLKLPEWEVRLIDHGPVGSLSPFEQWSDGQPTRSLAWYDAYNAVKHDRESAFERATLETVLKAGAALHILLSAEWGPGVFSRFEENYTSCFYCTKTPSWTEGDFYAPPFDHGANEEWRELSLNLP